ncbi:MAG: SRPBCC family protein [Myxococcales bacterium]|nr:SRPBCC family protein [Myxococcales bacterium]
MFDSSYKRMGSAVLGAAMVTWSMGCTATSGGQSANSWTEGDNAGADGTEPVLTAQPTQDAQEETLEAGRRRDPAQEAIPHRGELVRGRATVEVNAPFDVVREAVLDFDDYADFMPHYKSARTLGRKPDGSREVYMKWAALHGAIKLWARLELKMKKDGEAEIWESSFVDGNVKEAYATWRIEPLEGGKTKLTLEAFLEPRLPVPTSLLNEENVSAAAKGVTAMRNHCEGQ